MAVLSKADLLSAIAETPDIPTEEVDCPELGGAVRVRAITGTVRNRLEAAFAAIQDGADGKVMDKVIVALLSSCVVDDKGNAILTGDMAAKFFRNYPGAVFRIRDKAVEMAGMSEADKEKLTESFE